MATDIHVQGQYPSIKIHQNNNSKNTNSNNTNTNNTNANNTNTKDVRYQRNII